MVRERKRGRVTLICSCCQRQVSRTEFHHLYFGRDKRFKEFCNNPLNLVSVCVPCHLGRAKTYEFKLEQMILLVQRVGYDAVKEWLDSCPPKKRLGSEYPQAVILLERARQSLLRDT